MTILIEKEYFYGSCKGTNLTDESRPMKAAKQYLEHTDQIFSTYEKLASDNSCSPEKIKSVKSL